MGGVSAALAVAAQAITAPGNASSASGSRAGRCAATGASAATANGSIGSRKRGPGDQPPNGR